MSRTKRGEKGSGYEYSRKRYPRYFMTPGRENKVITNQYERRKAKQRTQKELSDGI